MRDPASEQKYFYCFLSYRPPSNRTINHIDDYLNKLFSLIEAIRSAKPATVVVMVDLNSRSFLFWDEETVENAAGKKLSNFMIP